MVFDELNSAIQIANTAVNTANSAYNVIWNVQGEQGNTALQDAAIRGSKPRTVGQNIGEFFLTGNGLWGETQADKDFIAAKNEIKDNIGDFSQVNNNENLYNIGLDLQQQIGGLKNPIAFGDTRYANHVINSLNEDIEKANDKTTQNYYNQAQQNNISQLRNNMLNYFKNGGSINIKPENKGKFTASAKRAGMGVQEFASHVLANKEDYSSTQVKRANFARNASKWKHADGGELNGITTFAEGGTHEQNPLGGIPQGIASDGNPNLVEEGEVKYKDYIYSARLKANKSLLKQNNLPEKYAGKSYAYIAEKLQKESEERPNDPISISTLESYMQRLQNAQETYKANQQSKQIINEFNNLPKEDQMTLLSQLNKDTGQFAKGGHLFLGGGEVPFYMNTPKMQQAAIILNNLKKQYTDEQWAQMNDPRGWMNLYFPDYSDWSIEMSDPQNEYEKAKAALDIVSNKSIPAESIYQSTPVKQEEGKKTDDTPKKTLTLNESPYDNIPYVNGVFPAGINSLESDSPVKVNPDLKVLPKTNYPSSGSPYLPEDKGFGYGNSPLWYRNPYLLALADPNITYRSDNDPNMLEQYYPDDGSRVFRSYDPTTNSTSNGLYYGIDKDGKNTWSFNFDRPLTPEVAAIRSKFEPMLNWTQEDLDKYYKEEFTNFWNSLKDKKGSNLGNAYLTGKQARDFYKYLSSKDSDIANRLADMIKEQWGNGELDWSDDATWEFKNKYNPNGTIVESDSYLKRVGDNAKRKDALAGIEHSPIISQDVPAKLADLNPLEILQSIPQESDTVPQTREVPVPEYTESSKTSDSATPSWLRYAPVIGSGIGAIVAATMGPDYSYANELRGIASNYTPLAARLIGGYERYTPYDINLANNEAMAQQSALQRANRASTNRASQTAQAIALENAYNKTNAARNLEWQQANETKRQAIDKYNLGIDQLNAGTVQAYDQLNSNINDRKNQMLARAAAARDDANTTWSENISNTSTNFFNNLGNVGRDQDAYNMVRLWLKANPQYATSEELKYYGV